MNRSNLIRVVASALVLSTLSFAAGVAGDLSLVAPPQHGTRVVVRIPPELPANTVRAGPLLSTASAVAAPLARPRFRPIVVETTNVELIEIPASEIILANAIAGELIHAVKTEQGKTG